MERSATDRVLIRSKDIGLLIGILTLCGIVWTAYSKPARWDQTSADLAVIKPIVETHTIKLAVIDNKFDTIIEELKDIKHEIKKK